MTRCQEVDIFRILERWVGIMTDKNISCIVDERSVLNLGFVADEVPFVRRRHDGQIRILWRAKKYWSTGGGIVFAQNFLEP